MVLFFLKVVNNVHCKNDVELEPILLGSHNMPGCKVSRAYWSCGQFKHLYIFTEHS